MPEITRFLLEKGALTEIRNEAGRTPKEVAVHYNQGEDIGELL